MNGEQRATLTVQVRQCPVDKINRPLQERQTRVAIRGRQTSNCADNCVTRRSYRAIERGAQHDRPARYEDRNRSRSRSFSKIGSRSIDVGKSEIVTALIWRWFTHPQTVSHPITNLAQCRLTLLIKPMPLTTTQRHHLA